MYENTYLYNFNRWSNDRKKKVDIYNLINDYYNICAPLNISHCTKYKEFFECEICEGGYFLTPDKQCELLPEEPIENCFEYKKKNVC